MYSLNFVLCFSSLYFSRTSFICKLDFLGKLLNSFFLKFLFLSMDHPKFVHLYFLNFLNFFSCLSYLFFSPRALLFSKCSTLLNCLFFNGSSNFPHLSEHKIAFPTLYFYSVFHTLSTMQDSLFFLL